MGSNPRMAEMNDAVPERPELNFSADISRQIWGLADSCFIVPLNVIIFSKNAFYDQSK